MPQVQFSKLTLAGSLGLLTALTGCMKATFLSLEKDRESRITAEVYVSGGSCGPDCSGLSVRNFKLYEDRRQVSRHESRWIIRPVDDVKIETLLLIDISASSGDQGVTRFRQSYRHSVLLESAKAYVEDVAMRAGAGSVGIAVFDGREEIEFIWPPQKRSGLDPLLTDPHEVRKKLDDLYGYQARDPSTNLYGAIHQGLDFLEDRAEQSHYYGGTLVVFSDGTHLAGSGGGYASFEETQARIEGLDSGNHRVQSVQGLTSLQVYTVGGGFEMDRGALWALNSGLGYYRRAAQVGSLFTHYSRSVEDLLDAAGAQYSLRYCSPSRAGEHELKLVVRKGLQRARVTEVYSADGFGPGCVAW